MSNGSGDSEGRTITTAGEFCTQFQNGIQALEALKAAFEATAADAVFLIEGRGPKPLPQVSGGCMLPLWIPTHEVTIGEIDAVLGDLQIFITAIRDGISDMDSGTTLLNQMGAAGS